MSITTTTPGLRLTVDADGACLSGTGPDGGRRTLPLAAAAVPAARHLIGEDPGAPADFRTAALAQLARFAIRNEGALSRVVDYNGLLPDGPPARPRQVSLIVTKLCNLRCLHCYNDSGLRDPHEMSEADKLALVDYLGRWGVTILSLTGGEPTIDPSFPAILATARRYRMGVKISTNAWHISPALAEAIRNGTVFQLSISVDGADPATHDTFRQRAGSYERVAASLRALADCRPKNIVLNAGVHRGSLHQMRQMAEFGARHGVDVLSYKPVTFTGRTGINRDFVLGHAEMAEFAATRDRLREEYAGRLVIDGKLTGDEVLPELEEDLNCQAAHTAMVIQADGRMLPCDTLTSVSGVPNVREVPPIAAWLNDPVFTWFRGIRSTSTGGCGTAGCPGMKASKQLAGAAPATFIPVTQLVRRSGA